MSERLTLQDLIDLLAQKKDLTKKDSETFLREFIGVVSETIESNDLVRIKDFGTFKLTQVSARKSVDVNTGEEIEIAPHYRLNFTPDKTLRDEINKPFAHFESVILEEGVTFKDEEKLFEGSTNYKTTQDLDNAEEEIEVEPEFIKKKGDTPSSQEDTETTNTDTIEDVRKSNKNNYSGANRQQKKSEDTKVNNGEDADMYSSEKMKENISNALSRDSEVEVSDEDGYYAQGTIEERIEKILNYQPKVIEVVKIVEATKSEQPTTVEDKVEIVEEEEIIVEEKRLEEAETTIEHVLQEEETVQEEEELTIIEPVENGEAEIKEELQSEETIEADLPPAEEKQEVIVEDNDTLKNTEKEENINQEAEEVIKDEEIVEKEAPSVENNVEQETDYKMEENKEKTKNYISEYDEEETSSYDDNIDYDNYYTSSSKKTYIYIAIAVVVVVGAFLAYRFYSAPEDANDILIENIDDTDEYNALVAETSGTDAEEEKKDVEKEAEKTIEKVTETKNTANLGVEVLKYGQTLRLISEKYYGDRSFWVYIYKENKSKISNPNSVPVGTSLTIPSLDKYNVSVKNAKDRSNAAQMERDILTSTGNY